MNVLGPCRWKLVRAGTAAACELVVSIVAALLLVVPAVAQNVCVRAAGGAFIIDVILNNRASVAGTVDTGASDLVLICDDVARALDLSGGQHVELQTAGGAQVARSAMIASVRLGAIEILDMPILVVPQTGPCRLLIGLSVLNRLARIEIVGDRICLAGRKGPGRRRTGRLVRR